MFRELSKRYSFWLSISCPIALTISLVFDEPNTILDYITITVTAVMGLMSICDVIYQISKFKKRIAKNKDKDKNKKPTHWTLGHSLRPELGFDDGTYLMRNAGKLLYPEYFDENGEPRLDMLPLDGQDRKKWKKEHKKENGK